MSGLICRWDDAAELAARGLRRERVAGGLSVARGGGGPLLVLFHGGSGSWNHWFANIGRLSEAFEVAALDLPGFGLSDAVDPEIPNDAYIALVAAAVDDLAGGGALHLSGFSFGGYVASRVAEELGPQIASLSLVAPNGFPPPDGRHAQLYGPRTLEKRLGRPPRADELREMHRNNLSELMLSEPVAAEDRLVDLHLWNVERTRFNSRRLSWSGGMAASFQRLTPPTSVIYGTRDRSQPPTIAGRMAELQALRPEVELVEIDGAGHWAMAEAPQAVEAAMGRIHGGAGR